MAVRTDSDQARTHRYTSTLFSLELGQHVGVEASRDHQHGDFTFAGTKHDAEDGLIFMFIE